MKKITFLLVALLFSTMSWAQCASGGAYQGAGATSDGNAVMLTDCAYAGEHSPVTGGMIIGNDYEFVGTGGAGNYLTFTDSSGNVIAHGPSPLTVNAITVTSGRVYVSTNAACETDSSCHTLTVRCVSATCVPPPAPDNDDCTSVTPTAIVNGGGPVTFTGTTIGATTNTEETAVFGEGAFVWEAITLSASCSNLTIDYCGTSTGYMDTAMVVYTDCLTDYTLGEYDFTTCVDGNATINFFNVPAGTYYIPVLSDGSVNILGDYVLNVSAIDCPNPPNCVTAPITPVDEATGVPAFDIFTLSWTAPATGPTPTSYDIYVGEMSDGSDLAFFENVTTTTYDVFVGAENATLYWSVVALNGTSEATGCDLLWSFTTGSAPTPPANDNLCNAIALDMNTESAGNAFYDISATGQSGEVVGSCFDDGINGSVWFSFIAPTSGQVTVSTNIAGGTHGDTEIAIYAAPSDCANAATLGAEIDCSQDIDLTNYLSEINATGLTPGVTYYIQVDRWGTADPGYFGISVFDSTLSIDDATQNQFTYFPNPVKNTLQMNAQSNIQNVSIFNMLGQEVLRTVPNNVNSTLDMSALQTGAYFVKVTINDRTETVRVIKQ